MRERKKGGCPPGSPTAPASLEEICADYVEYRKTCCDDRDYYERVPRIAEAITQAALARRADGRRCSHHTRKPRALLERASRRLLEAEDEIGRSSDFDALIGIVGSVLRGTKGLGPLYLFDTALRIGYSLRLLPQRVFLHAGTRVGAAALGLNVKRETIARHEFPAPLSSFDAAAIEDILCIYKDRLRAVRATLRP